MANKFFSPLVHRITRLSDTDVTPRPFSLARVLSGASRIYHAGQTLHRLSYRSGLLRSRRLSCPVISVGNITAGGTGKTPMAIFLAALLAEQGKKAVVVSRGYKGLSKARAAVAGDGKRVFLDADQAGDEPCMMALMKQFPVVVGKNRYTAGQLALEQFAPDAVILDDGFQHHRLGRTLDLLLLDHDRPFGNGRLLPAGRLRERPETARQRAHAVILTRCPDTGQMDAGHPVFNRFPGLPVFYTRHRPFPAHWVPATGQTGRKNGAARLSRLKDKKLLLFSGIAQNRAFARTVEQLSGIILEHLEFNDHYRYKRADLYGILERARQLGAHGIATTQKDWARLGPDQAMLETTGFEVAVLGIAIEFEDKKGFQTFIQTHLTL